MKYLDEKYNAKEETLSFTQDSLRSKTQTLDKLKAKSPFAPNIGLGQMDPKLAGLCGPSKVKYHAGAVAAWEEAGYKVADCAK